MKPVRWVVEFTQDGISKSVMGGAPKWTAERLHLEVTAKLGPHYTGRFVPLHLKKKPKFYRMHGVKGFTDIRRMWKPVNVLRIAA